MTLTYSKAHGNTDDTEQTTMSWNNIWASTLCVFSFIFNFIYTVQNNSHYSYYFTYQYHLSVAMSLANQCKADKHDSWCTEHNVRLASLKMMHIT